LKLNNNSENTILASYHHCVTILISENRRRTMKNKDPISVHVDGGAGALPYTPEVQELLASTLTLDKLAVALLPHVSGTLTLTQGEEVVELEGTG
jgi:hypothetical protein